MKRKPKLTNALKNEFRIVEVFNSTRTLLEAAHNKKRTINFLCQETHMYKTTFYRVLERVVTKGYIIYDIIGRGKSAKNMQVTESGINFLNLTMRRHPSLRKVSSVEKFMDLDNQDRLRIIPAAVMTLDIELGGAIGRWRCPIHPKSVISYKVIKGIGAQTVCQESGCGLKNDGMLILKSYPPFMIQVCQFTNIKTGHIFHAHFLF